MSWLDNLPIWAVYIVTVAVALAAAEFGFRIGIRRQRRDSASEGAPMTGAVVGGMLGLMAFLMAFSIGIVIGQQNDRKTMVVTEANAVGTAYLRSGFLDEPDLTTSRNLLREYVEVRLAAATDPACVMLPMTPVGQTGCRFAPMLTGATGWPSRVMAALAQKRP